MTSQRESPGDHDPRLPSRWKHALDEQVRGRFGDDVRDVVDRRDKIVGVCTHPKLSQDVLMCAFVHDPGIGDLCRIVSQTFCNV